MISLGEAWIQEAIDLRAASIKALALRPSECVLEGLPKSFCNVLHIMSSTSGSSGVVAALSRYILSMDYNCLK